VTCHGPDVSAALLQAHATNDALIEEVGRMCTLATKECEQAKCTLMESTFPKICLAMVREATVSLPAVVALLAALQGTMTHDDARPPASKAFMHSRVLALDKEAVPVFLAALDRATDEPDSLHGIISSLQQLCANDEICVRVRAGRGLLACVVLFSSFVQECSERGESGG
jgi:armadillo repeat-containing protein 6